MKSLDELPSILDNMLSKQKEQKQKTYVARYNGQNIVCRSGKSSWKKMNHAKAAIIQHFSEEERSYEWDSNSVYDHKDARAREKEFRNKLWELIEIVELKD